MTISPDLLTQYVNRKQYDLAKVSLEGMVDAGYHFRNFNSINSVRSIVATAINVESMKIPQAAFARYHMVPECNQLMAILRNETRKVIAALGKDDKIVLDRLGDVAMEVLTAASQSAPENLRTQTLNAFIAQLLQTGYPREVGMKASAFKLYRDHFLSQDLGL